MKTLIKNIDILTMDDNSTQYKDGCIAIEDDKIIWVGQGIPKDFIPDTIEEGAGKVALPGWINTHTHVAMTLFRGYANDLPLWEWLTEKIWPLEDKMNPQDAYWLSLLGIAEMIQSGITTFSDMYMFMEETARGVKESGIRAVLARGLQGSDEKSRGRLYENRKLWENWHGKAEGRIRVMAGPHAVYTCTPEYLIECRDMAQELDIGLHIHLSETRREVEECRGKYGKSPVAHLLDLGLLEGHVLAAHCVHINEDDMNILKKKDVRISHCPASNLKLGSGISPVQQILDRGINVSLGTDGASSNNSLNIMKEMMLAALIAKGTQENPTLLQANQVLRMATEQGSRALDWQHEIGSLEVGKKADIILLNTNMPHYYPRTDWEAHLVYSGQGSDVDTVWVNGRLLLHRGNLVTIDIEQVYREVEKIRTRILGAEI